MVGKKNMVKCHKIEQIKTERRGEPGNERLPYIHHGVLWLDHQAV
jgi:hypothetical protein